MKKCSSCKKTKNKDEFYKNSTRKDGLQTDCKECTRIRLNKRYRTKEGFRSQRYIWNKKRRRRITQGMFQYLKDKECRDCGNKDMRVFEFDHLKDKENSINEMLRKGWSWKNILKEVSKCDIVCANCHRIRTLTRAAENGKTSYRLAGFV